MLTIGLAQERWAPQVFTDGKHRLDLFYRSQWLGFQQLGVACLVLALASLAWRRFHPSSWGWASDRVLWLVPRIVVPLVIFGVTGELALRAYFWNGESFSRHYGPIVREFEKGFRVHSELDGSRGPTIDADDEAASPRILIQGDSVTWGQGVRLEADIYTSRTLAALRAGGYPSAVMEVFALGGWEMDSHVAAIERHGKRCRPDVIVYQWLVNDCEIDCKARRPGGGVAPWRSLFVHPILARTSYLWFFLDDRLVNLSGPGMDAYYGYLRAEFTGDTPAWRTFERSFVRWARYAKSLTPDVIVLLYPDEPVGAIRQRVAALCERESVAVLDLQSAFDSHDGPEQELSASPYDRHPSATAHDILARELTTALLARLGERSSRR